jgi:hypothetical protein
VPAKQEAEPPYCEGFKRSNTPAVLSLQGRWKKTGGTLLADCLVYPRNTGSTLASHPVPVSSLTRVCPCDLAHQRDGWCATKKMVSASSEQTRVFLGSSLYNAVIWLRPPGPLQGPLQVGTGREASKEHGGGPPTHVPVPAGSGHVNGSPSMAQHCVNCEKLKAGSFPVRRFLPRVREVAA